MINLLDDALFAVSRAKERVVVTLPEVVVGLATGHVSALHGINAVQRQFVWRLLVRCAAHAAERDATLVYDAEGLREFLASTTPDRASWDLYRDDSGPAFLQVPLGAATANDDGYKREDLARLTIVPGDKNHEFKRGVSARLCPSDALYALVEYQFGSIFTKGNYATQLTGSTTGKGSGTPFMAPWFSSLSDTFLAHLEASVAASANTRDIEGLHGDVWALWALPWVGAKIGMPASMLAPHFIPLSRRVRLGPPDQDGVFGELWFRSTEGPRIADHTQGGGLGDPFAPRIFKELRPKVRGVMSTGFDYREVARLLLDAPVEPKGQIAFAVAHAARRAAVDQITVVMEGMAFDQGKTMGFHRRMVQVPRLSILDPAPLAVLLDAMLTDAKSAETALAAASRTWLNGSSRPRRGDRDKITRLRTILTRKIDNLFINEFATMTPGAAREDAVQDRQHRWRASLTVATELALTEVMASTPVPIARRFERQALATDALTLSLLRAGWSLGPEAPANSLTPAEDLSLEYANE